MTESEPKVIYATVREAGDGIDKENHIECRFSDGQKLAAIVVDIEFEKLAQNICSYLNNQDPCREALAELVRLEGTVARGPDNVGELRELQRQHKEAMAAARAALEGKDTQEPDK